VKASHEQAARAIVLNQVVLNDVDLEEAAGLALSIARATRVIGRFPTSAFNPLFRISASLMPTRPSGGSSAYAGSRSVYLRPAFESRLSATIS
jgi:hypothetical protein